MACQIAQTDPKIRLVVNALHRSCMGSVIYPVQPTSSHAAGRKNTTKKIGISRNGRARAKTNTKNVSGDPFNDALVFITCSLLAVKFKNLHSSSERPARKGLL